MFRFFRRRKPTPDVSENYTDIGTGVNMDTARKIVPIRLPDSERKRGMMVVGSTGVGKTRLAEHMIDQDIEKGYSLIYLDPKGDQDIFSKVFESARKHRRHDELQLITPIYPELSAIVDPMAYYFSVEELAAHIAAAIPPSKEEFFKGVAVMLSTAVITASTIIARNRGQLANLNFDALRNGIRRKNLEDSRVTLQGIGSPEALRTAGIIEDLLGESEEYYSKVSKSLSVALMHLSIGNIGRIIGQADTNRIIQRIEEGERVIVVIHTGSQMFPDAANALGRVLLSMIQKCVGRTYGSVKEKFTTPLAIYIDEAQKVLYPGIEALPAMAGSANVMTTMFVQDNSQLDAVLGKEFARIIMNNCNTKLFMRCPDADTSEYVTRHFGTKPVLTGIYSANQVTTREVEQDVIKPYDVQSLQVQEFLMQTYSGRWKGKTSKVPKAAVKVIFPDRPGTGSSYQTFEDELDEEATA